MASMVPYNNLYFDGKFWFLTISKQYFNGNAYQKGRIFYNSADLEDMGKSSQLKNQAQASVAVIERLA